MRGAAYPMAVPLSPWQRHQSGGNPLGQGLASKPFHKTLPSRSTGINSDYSFRNLQAWSISVPHGHDSKFTDNYSDLIKIVLDDQAKRDCRESDP
jgi:hypothetical protein